ncbi:MAG: hypothetical protein JXR37_34210 [Kiritimatiellae bacterium]|nr:hypothetical protein [Kiritimatiellia bacterium]
MIAQSVPGNNESGMVLTIVLCFVLIVSAIAGALLMATGTQLIFTRNNVRVEQALHVAEGGAEHAAAYLAAGGRGPAVIEGAVGAGAYVATIATNDAFAVSPPSGGHLVAGSLNVNPNNSPDNEFVLVKPDGSMITRDDSHEDFAGYAGPATFVRLKPKGNGTQSGLAVDGTTYPIENKNTYTFSDAGMSVQFWNDQINAQGKAVGQWWLYMDGANVSVSASVGGADLVRSYMITSTGTIHGVSRKVVLRGVRNLSWAKFAMWMHDNRQIYFKAGEQFRGAVHANNDMWFGGDPEFWGPLTSAATTYGGSTNACLFHNGFGMGVPAGSMAGVDFGELEQEADLIVTGATTLVFSGEAAVISNAAMGWAQVTKRIADNELVYVRNGAGSEDGDIAIAGTLAGRITIVAERDINITGHVTYADDPRTHPGSRDALGLVAKRNVVVKPSCPDDLEIQAHIMATGVLTATRRDGSFGVEGYASGPPRGMLTVYGGIVQDYRGAVGTFDPHTGQMNTGYYKHYTYDARFAVDPPPHYPSIQDEFEWTQWEDYGA